MDGMKGMQKIRCFTGENCPFGATEHLWCELRDDGTYRVANIPFFVDDLNFHDQFRAVLNSGALWVGPIVERSGHKTIRIFLTEGHDDSESATALTAELRSLGVMTEGALPIPMLVVSVPPEIDSNLLDVWLTKKKLAGLIEEESG